LFDDEESLWLTEASNLIEAMDSFCDDKILVEAVTDSAVPGSVLVHLHDIAVLGQIGSPFVNGIGGGELICLEDRHVFFDLDVGLLVLNDCSYSV
jgi:hypothetical protein